MTQDFKNFNPEKKQRVTVFINPTTIRKAKARSAMEVQTLSELTENILDEFELMELLEHDSFRTNQKNTQSGFINIYGVNLSGTPRVQWREKLEEECKKRGLI